MNSKHGVTQAAQHEHVVHVRALDEHLSSDQSFSSAYARTLGALAVTDGKVTLAQFATLTELAGDGKVSAIFTALVLNAIESGVDLDWAMNALAKSATGAELSAREAAFQTTLPLLALHGAHARALAQRLARALDVRPPLPAWDQLPPADERGLLTTFGLQARKLITGRDLSDAIIDFGRSIGQPQLIEHVQQFQSGLIGAERLRELVRSACAAIGHDIAAYQERASTHPGGDAGFAGLAQAAQELRQQVQQRLALIDARIAHERNLLVEEIDDAVRDAGNAIELALAERLEGAARPDGDVGAGMSRQQFGQQMERRLDRVARRKEEALRLLQDDLRLFQAAMRLGQARIFQRQHFNALAKLMPRLRVGTRLAHGVGAAAKVTLMGGAVAAAGTGTAAYLFGMAVVMPVVAPVAPFVGGAVLLAGALTWLADGGKRKRAEIRDQRREFEAELRQQLHQAELAFNAQLDLVAEGFYVSAQQSLAPVSLEAEAAGRVPGMRARIAERVIAQAQAAIARLEAELGPA